MKQYIGTKLVKAEPCKAWKDAGEHETGDDGYKVIYPDGYESWSPKDVFEEAYLQVQDNPHLPSGCSVGPDMVDDFIRDVHVSTLGDKNTVVRAVLVNGAQRFAWD